MAGRRDVQKSTRAFPEIYNFGNSEKVRAEQAQASTF